MEIVVGMILLSCKNDKVNKWIAENLDILPRFTCTGEFVNYSRKGHVDMIINKGLPAYSGKGPDSQKKEAVIKVDEKKKTAMERWEACCPCFQCGQGGHTKLSCKHMDIPTCKEECCGKFHSKKHMPTWKLIERIRMRRKGENEIHLKS